jgi:hypothetical protein
MAPIRAKKAARLSGEESGPAFGRGGVDCLRPDRRPDRPRRGLQFLYVAPSDDHLGADGCEHPRRAKADAGATPDDDHAGAA